MVTVSNVSMQLSGDVFESYLSVYGDVEEVTQIKTSSRTAYGDYTFIMCLDRRGFISHTIKYRDKTMMVVVEGRRPLCWSCKELGRFSPSCPQKTTTTTATSTKTATNTAALTNTTATSIVINETETGDQPNKEEGWTQVTRRKKSLLKTSSASTTDTTMEVTFVY